MKKVKKYLTVFKINFLNDLMYTQNYIGLFLFFAMILFVFSYVWGAIYEGREVIEGFSYHDILWYFMFTETIMISKGTFHREMANDIKSGDIAYNLNKPYSYILYYFFKYMSTSITRLVINTIIGIIIISLLAGNPPFTLLSFSLGMITVFLGLTLNFVFFFLLGISALWFEDNTAFIFIYSKILFTVGGMFVPIEFFPGFIRTIADALPFKYILYAPARVYVTGTELFLETAFFQIINIIIYGSLVYFIFYLGKKRFAVNGG